LRHPNPACGGCYVTVVKDTTADYSDEMMHAALDINMPNYASAIVTTRELVDSLSSVQSLAVGAQRPANGIEPRRLT